MRGMLRQTLLFTAAAAVLLTAAALAGEDPHTAGDHAQGMTLLATLPTGQGGDIAFEGDLAIVGHGFANGVVAEDAGFDVVDVADPARPHVLSRFRCPATGQDVSIYRDLVILSSDVQKKGGPCAPGGDAPPVNAGDTFAGLVIVSIADPSRPRFVTGVRKLGPAPGSHTHTLVPDRERRRLLVYVNAPLGGQQVVEVPLKRPQDARVLGLVDTAPSNGCHDMTVLLDGDEPLAACAGTTETQLWRIRRDDPTHPRRLSRITNPSFTSHHSAVFSRDGDTLVLSDETAAVGTPACNAGTDRTDGRLWFYDISDPARPRERSSFMPEHRLNEGNCTAHQFSLVPLKDRDVVVGAWGSAGTVIVDFTDPSNPAQLAHYVPRPLDTADFLTFAAYFHRGHVFANHAAMQTPHPRGFDVMRSDVLDGALHLDRLNAQTQEVF